VGCPFHSPIHGQPNNMTMQKPYIKLDQDFPGIVSLFMYDRETAKNLTAMGQTIMRRERAGLSPGQRELIASFVSKLNDCKFCCDSHTACAKEYLGDELVDEVIRQCNAEVLPEKFRALLCIAAAVQGLDRNTLPRVVAQAKELGASDEEIHDTVLVTAFFCMCNRYVDGLGTTFQTGEPEEGGRSLATYGYTMGIRRFFREVLPKMWSRFWG
jgi:uncharacterized peroxidase-related enzyme